MMALNKALVWLKIETPRIHETEIALTVDAGTFPVQHINKQQQAIGLNVYEMCFIKYKFIDFLLTVLNRL